MSDFRSQLKICATRRHGRTEADIQSDIKQLLKAGQFLDDTQPLLETQTDDGTGRRIDIEYGALVIECKKLVDPHRKSELAEFERQLAGYLAVRQKTCGTLYAGVLTDGVRWRHYRLDADDTLVFVSEKVVDPASDDDRAFREWLGSALPTEPKVVPDAATIEARLGAGSPAHDITVSRLAELLDHGREVPEVVLKKGLWSKLLRTAFGTQFEGTDELFVEHTYLVTLAVLIARTALGLPESQVPGRMLSGEEFAEAGITGVGEAGFFDWMLGVPGGDEVITDIARRVAAFDWSKTDHDVLKALYQSVISPEVRHRLGEYYTPDWLADRMVRHVVDDPLHQRVLDPACGSGTFSFWAITSYFEAADAAGIEVRDAVDTVCEHVAGVDLHPVAVALAQVTYLLAVGMDRLAERSATFSVPVYLGDSMRWEEVKEAGDTLFDRSGDVVIDTTDREEMRPTSRAIQREMLPADLRFPSNVVARTDFDALVNDMVQRATTGPRSIKGILDRYSSSPAERKTLQDTFELLCSLHDQGRDHIWGFFVRNQARPAWFAQEEHRVDVLVGNPPWLSYRYMPARMQQRFQQRSKMRNLWSGGKVATHQDLSAFFVVRSVELYLTENGRFAFVTPYAVLSRMSYEGFRTGHWNARDSQLSLGAKFEQPWSLDGIRPDPFPVPSAVVLGVRSWGESVAPVPPVTASLTGRAVGSGPWSSVAPAVTVSDRTVMAVGSDDELGSTYGERFRQGATLVPRVLLFVDDGPANPLLTSRQRSVRSHRSVQEKAPWKSLDPLEGSVETQFVRPVLLGESIIPFAVVAPLEAVIPWSKSTGLMDGSDPKIESYSGLAKWWRSAEVTWERYRGAKSTMTLRDQVDYRSKLAVQFPIAPIRVVYTKSGNTLAAAVVKSDAVIDHSLYWAAVPSMDEGRYLTAVLNAPTLTELVQPYQSVGAFGPRHFDKYVWKLPTPLFDPTDPLHRRLVKLAEKAEGVTKGVAPAGGFQQHRRLVRNALAAAGVAAELDAAVRELLE